MGPPTGVYRPRTVPTRPGARHGPDLSVRPVLRSVEGRRSVSCGERRRDGADSLEELAQVLEQTGLAGGALEPVDRLAVLEHDERGDAHDVELAGQVGVLVHVDLGDGDLV